MKHRVFRAAAALVLSASLLLPLGVMTARAEEYTLDPHRTAASQLEELFTTVDLMDATISELQAEMQAGRLTSARLTQMYLDRIRAYDETAKLNSVISINPDAIRDAQALDEARVPGEDMGQLYGIPIIVKDNYDVKGMATAAGAIALKDNIAEEDSFAVKQLRDAGAVIIGRANMSEFAVSAVDSHSTLGGDTHNAYDVTKTPAGSSGGTAVAVTSNFAAAGLGTDTGGSIRNPANVSNLYGIRPSKGLTSISGVVPLSAARDTTGPMARTAEDLAAVLEVIAGTDPEDDFTQEAGADALLGEGYTAFLSEDGLQGKRIGFLQRSFSYEYLEDPEDEDSTAYHLQDEKITQMVKKTKSNLAKAGAEFVDLSELLPDEALEAMLDGAGEDSFEYDINKYLHAHPSCPYQTLRDIIFSQVSAAPDTDVNYISNYLSNYAKKRDELADSFENTPNPYTTEINGYQRGESWAATLESRAYLSGFMEEHHIDAIMYLSFFDVAASETDGIEFLNGYAWFFGPALGLPEITIPMGFGETTDACRTEMPLGINLVAGFGDERTLLEIAYAYEKQAGDFIRRQPATSPPLEDKTVNAYLNALMEAVYSIDYAAYNSTPSGKVQLMVNACARADAVDRKDAAATCAAAMELAEAYDNVMAALAQSGWKEARFVGHPKNQDGRQITADNLDGLSQVSIRLENIPQEVRKVSLCAALYSRDGQLPSCGTVSVLPWEGSVDGVIPIENDGNGAAFMRIFALDENARPLCDAYRTE